MAEQMNLPDQTEGANSPAPDNGVTASGEAPKKARKKSTKKKASKKVTKKKASKKATKKTAKKATKKASKSGGKKASKKTSGKKSGKRKAAKRSGKKRATRAVQGCTAVVHVSPTANVTQLAAWSEMSRYERRRALILAGTALVAAGTVTYLLLRPRKASAAEPDVIDVDAEEVDTDGDEDTGGEEDTGEEDTGEEDTGEEDTGEEDTGEEDTEEEEPSEEPEDAEIDVNVEVGATPLPPPIELGKIPPLYTRIYQLFDRFVVGGMEFFANLGDSEAGHNIYAVNPKGVPLSKASVTRQMKSPTYGKEWSGTGKVPYTAYVEPEEAKKLGAIGLFQGIAGTIGQAGRRNGTALLAPMDTDSWMDPANQLAAFYELFGALYHEFGAKTPVAMRIAWGYPSKANKVNDPYYVDRAAKWADRQKKTGVSIDAFDKMTLRDHSVEEVAAYFRQFDYSPIIEAAKKAPRMAYATTPLSAEALTRLEQQLDEHPGIIGNDLT